MKIKINNNGSALMLVVFAVALFAALVMGIAQINTEEIQLMQNHVNIADALTVANAGLNDAFYELRSDSNWNTGFTDKAFNSGSYTVTVAGSLPNLTLQSTGTSAEGFVAVADANLTLTQISSPYIIRVDSLRINE